MTFIVHTGQSYTGSRTGPSIDITPHMGVEPTAGEYTYPIVVFYGRARARDSPARNHPKYHVIGRVHRCIDTDSMAYTKAYSSLSS